jgi:hypothetical protein
MQVRNSFDEGCVAGKGRIGGTHTTTVLSRKLVSIFD